MTVLGIDTSHHNALPDFAALALGGVGYVFAKATEGTGFADPQYAASRAGAKGAGIVFGSYHFARPGDPTAQADYYLQVAKPAAGEITALDFEDTTIGDPVGFADVWCRQVKAAVGAPPLLYLNQWFLTRYDWSRLLADGDALWLARYDGVPAGGPSGVWPLVAFKQFTDRATVPGQPGTVDEDAFTGSLEQLSTYAIPGDDMTPEQYAAVVGRLDQLIGAMTGVHAFAAAADVVINDPTTGVPAQFAALRGQVAGLTTALGQLTSGSVDLASVQAAAGAGVHAALTELAAKLTAPAGS